MQRRPFTNDPESWSAAALYERSAALILAYLRLHTAALEDAEDLLLEVFLAALEWKSLSRLPPGEQMARLLQVAHHKLGDYSRHAAQPPMVLLEQVQALLEAADPALTPQQQTLRQEERRRLIVALQQLEPHQRQVLHLRFAVGLRCAQIGPLLGKREETIRQLLARTLAPLRSLYGERQQDGHAINDHDEAPFSAEAIDEQIDLATERLWSKLASDMPTPQLRLIEDVQRAFPTNDEEMAQALERVSHRLAQVTSDSSEAQPGQWRWQADLPDQENARATLPPRMPPGGRQPNSIPVSLVALVSAVLLVALIGSLTIGFLLGRQHSPVVSNQLPAISQTSSTPPPTAPTLQPSSTACPFASFHARASLTIMAQPSTITFTEFPIPTAGSGPAGIAAGPDGNLWFTEFQARHLARITPAGGVLEYPTRSYDANANPSDIVAGPDGNLWYTQRIASQIGRLWTDGRATEWPVTPNSAPFDIAAGPDGNLWFTESDGNKIGQITPCLFFRHEYAVPTANSQPCGITAGPDGNLWFTEHRANKIGRLSPDGATAEFPLPTANSAPDEITAGPDGNLWFTEVNAHKIGRISPAGVITEFPVPLAHSLENGGITSGPDGDLWFTEPGDNLIGRITPAGSVTEFPVPTANAAPEGIIGGPDGALWFTEFAANKIGRITLGK